MPLVGAVVTAFLPRASVRAAGLGISLLTLVLAIVMTTSFENGGGFQFTEEHQWIEVFGALHGAAFVAYGTVALLTWWVQQWRPVVGLLSLAAAVPPFGTIAFEVWAQRRGHLDDRTPA